MADKQVLPITTLIDPDNLNLAEFLDEEELAELGGRLRKALYRAQLDDDSGREEGIVPITKRLAILLNIELPGGG